MATDETCHTFLSEDILLHIFSFLEDAADVARAMAVCTPWRRTASQVEFVSTSIPDVPISYEGKVSAIRERLKAFPRLVSAHVSIGKPRPRLDDTLRRCMRYAEVGSSVDKFLFLAAKTGDNEVFFDASEPSEFAADSAPSDAGNASMDQRNCHGSHCSVSVSAQTSDIPKTDTRHQVHLPLLPVVGPSDSSLRLMMPVIVFAIIRGFDDLVQCLPDIAHEIPSLQNLLVVDRSDNVTLNVRKHHFEQLRSQPPASQSLGEVREAFSHKDVLAELNPLGQCGSQGVTVEPEENLEIQDEGNSENISSSRLQGAVPPAEGSIASEGTTVTSSDSEARTSSLSVALHELPAEQSLEQPPRILDLSTQTEVDIRSPPEASEERYRTQASTGDSNSEEESFHQRVREHREARMLELSTSPKMDVSFWRAEEAAIGQWKVRDISVCIASNGSVPLQKEELEALGRAAICGPILKATMIFVNAFRCSNVL